MSAPPAERAGTLRALLADAARLDRTQSDPVVSARNAVGVALPLVIAAATGSAAAGLAPTIGAIQTAFADRPGPYRLRVLRMTGTALVAATTGFLSTLLAPHLGLSVLLLAVLGLVAGMLVAAGPAAAQVGTAGLAAAIILGHIPQPLSGAVHVGLLVLIGGLGQTVLAVAAWPLGRHRPERTSLATLYRELAAAARRPQGPRAGPPAAAAVDAVRATLYGLGHDSGPSVEAYRVLLDEAERMRRDVVTLAALVERLADERPDAADAIGDALVAAADELDEIATALEQTRPVPDTAQAAAAAALRRARERTDADSGGSPTGRAATARLDALAGELRAAARTTATGAQEGRRVEEPDLPGTRRLRDPIATLRANLTPGSAVARHALRLGVLVAASDLVTRLADVQRGYWVPLTVLVVLRPDFATTFQRACMRVLGTVVGLLLATVLVHFVPGGEWYAIALVALFFFGVRLAGPGNLGILAVALSGLVVVLLALAGVPAHETLVARSVATAVGGGLALVATLFWPAWERTVLPARAADLLEAYRGLALALADPDASRADRQAARARSRRARTEAQASLARARAEPVPSTDAVELGESVLANSHRVVHALMTVDAVRAGVRRCGGLPELDRLLQASAAALGACATAVRTARPLAAGVGSVRPVQYELDRALHARPDAVGGEPVAAALVEASDRLTNAVDTLLGEVRRRFGRAPARGGDAAPRPAG